ncbi:MAG: hypothetical protein WAX89_03670 [Alphaproteobacteria bacterium]
MRRNNNVIFAFLAAMSLSGNVFAGTIADGAVACISQKMLHKYTDYTQAGAELFAKDLRDRAACYISRGGEVALPLEASKTAMKLELERGHTVWVQTASYQAAEGEKPLPTKKK